jgi:hypothetical protein
LRDTLVVAELAHPKGAISLIFDRDCCWNAALMIHFAALHLLPVCANQKAVAIVPRDAKHANNGGTVGRRARFWGNWRLL